jgi:hypothetical protein
MKPLLHVASLEGRTLPQKPGHPISGHFRSPISGFKKPYAHYLYPENLFLHEYGTITLCRIAQVEGGAQIHPGNNQF